MTARERDKGVKNIVGEVCFICFVAKHICEWATHLLADFCIVFDTWEISSVIAHKFMSNSKWTIKVLQIKSEL